MANSKKTPVTDAPVESSELPPFVTIDPTPPKLTYAQKLASMDPAEAAAIRAKANESSRKSKAKARGFESPEAARAMTLNAALTKNHEKTALLAKEREKIEAELTAIAEAAKESAIVEAPAAEETTNENS